MPATPQTHALGRFLVLGLAALSRAESPGANLRGSGAAPAPAVDPSDARAEQAEEEHVEHLQCSCSEISNCSCFSNASFVQSDEDKEFQTALLNHTQCKRVGLFLHPGK